METKYTREPDNGDATVNVEKPYNYGDGGEEAIVENTVPRDRHVSKPPRLHSNGSGKTVVPDTIDLVLSEIGEKNDDDGTVTKTLRFEGTDEDDDTDTSSPSCSDPMYRNKVIDTIWLFWNVTVMGWVYGQMGPSLPDLQVISGAPLQQATWLFTGFAIGYLVGCLLAGFIQEKFNARLMLFLSTIGNAVTMGVLPWIPNFHVMVVLRALNGLAIGGQDTGLHSMLFALWAKESGPFVQMTHCLSAVGGIISPLVTQQFTLDSSSDSQVNVSPSNSTVSPGNTTSGHISTPESNIHWAFLITGILLTTAAIPFFVAFLRKQRIKKTTRQYSNDSVDRHKIPKKIKGVIIAIVLTNSFIATSYIDLFPSFLTTFVLQVPELQMDLNAASTLTSIYFGTYGVGNFIGVFVLNYITSTKLIIVSYVTSGATLIGLLLSVTYTNTTTVWVTVAMSGVTMSAILPTIFTWTQENVTPITGKMASALLVSGSAGVTLNPLLLGYLMEDVSPMWFLYLTLGDTVICALLFTTALVLAKTFSAGQIPEVQEVSSDVEISHGSRETPERDEVTIEGKTKIYPRGTLFGV